MNASTAGLNADTGRGIKSLLQIVQRWPGRGDNNKIACTTTGG